ncbi:MAG: FAD binding domain-containing protein [Pseudomonadota bacterium]
MTYSSPPDLETALDALRSGDPCIVAGGTDVYPAMSQGKAPASFLDVTGIAGLAAIQTDGDTIRIGAVATWSDIVNADLPPAFDALKSAARDVGSVQIQNAGTVAGNLCNASPAADGVPPLLALDATVELASAARGVRMLPLAAFITGVRQTALARDELVLSVHVPKPPAGMTSAFGKLGSRRYLVISIAMTAVNLVLDGQGRIAEARVAIGACSAVAQRLPTLEADLIGQRPEAVVVAPEHLAPLAPIDDARASADYRWVAAAEQCARVIKRAATG